MKVKFFAALFIATASFEIFEATDMALLHEFMEYELPPGPMHSPTENNDTKLPNSPICPRELKVSWKLQPPFTLENYSKQDQPQAYGILHKP